ncbi:MAG TPA: Nif3-like dinuclear metal center hexameric protein [Thermoanaerobacter sp.]|nr:Nif3-like dinuclear metal center hexameric protein [Thermoanaerobacter sp.]
MGLKCQVIASIMDKLAPRKFAEEWDNVGLLIGDGSKDISKVLVALDATSEVIKEAVDKKVDMIVTHHPLIFKPIKNVRADNPVGSLLIQLIKNDISLYAAHTSFDIAPNGVNDILCNVLGIYDREVLDVTYSERYKKIAVYVPQGYEEVVRNAMCSAGAGFVGNYSDATFQARGIGTYRPLEGTNPFIGETGKLEKTEEVKIESIVPQRYLEKVVTAMLNVHPYEEVAYDIYSLENVKEEYGLGRIGIISETTLQELALQVKAKFKINNLRVVGDLNKKIRKVAVCGGSGASLIHKAVSKGADVLITADIGYHDAVEAQHLGLALIDAGHFATENIAVRFIAEYIIDETQKQGHEIEVLISESQKDPFMYL